MKKRLNNKGYMLVEIILAFSLAMVLVYFMTDITIKLKNKNDDLLVKTLVSADQAIIYNTIMKDLYTNAGSFNCSNIINSISDHTFTYNGFKNVISDYATVGSPSCSINGNKIEAKIPISVSALADDGNFDVNIKFNK